MIIGVFTFGIGALVASIVWAFIYNKYHDQVDGARLRWMTRSLTSCCQDGLSVSPDARERDRHHSPYYDEQGHDLMIVAFPVPEGVMSAGVGRPRHPETVHAHAADHMDGACRHHRRLPDRFRHGRMGMAGAGEILGRAADHQHRRPWIISPAGAEDGRRAPGRSPCRRSPDEALDASLYAAVGGEGCRPVIRRRPPPSDPLPSYRPRRPASCRPRPGSRRSSRGRAGRQGSHDGDALVLPGLVGEHGATDHVADRIDPLSRRLEAIADLDPVARRAPRRPLLSLRPRYRARG